MSGRLLFLSRAYRGTSPAVHSFQLLSGWESNLQRPTAYSIALPASPCHVLYELHGICGGETVILMDALEWKPDGNE